MSTTKPATRLCQCGAPLPSAARGRPQVYCANCRRETLAERNRRYYEANKDAVAERNRRYRAANKDAAAEYKRRYRDKNKLKLKCRAAGVPYEGETP